MQLTRGADYALRGMTFLARQDSLKYIRIREISDSEDIPEKFMRKLIHILNQKGYLESVRGKNGGIRLGIEADEITMLDIIEAVEGPMALNKCLKEPSECDFIDLCTMCSIWYEAQKELKAVLEKYTLKDIANGSTGWQTKR